MSGLVVFRSLRAALDAGYHIYGRTDEGYLARMRTDAGWALALVECSGTTQSMERKQEEERRPDQPDPNDAKSQEDEESYDKTVADSFPASDPPAQP